MRLLTEGDAIFLGVPRDLYSKKECIQINL
jgi:hypothetical protein